MTTSELSTTLDDLVAVARTAGVDEAAARAEGEQLAAAVAEPATGVRIWSRRVRDGAYTLAVALN